MSNSPSIFKPTLPPASPATPPASRRPVHASFDSNQPCSCQRCTTSVRTHPAPPDTRAELVEAPRHAFADDYRRWALGLSQLACSPYPDYTSSNADPMQTSLALSPATAVNLRRLCHGLRPGRRLGARRRRGHRRLRCMSGCAASPCSSRGRRLGPRVDRPVRVVGQLPDMAVGIGDVGDVAAPLRGKRLRCDVPPAASHSRIRPVDFGRRFDVDGECDTGELRCARRRARRRGRGQRARTARSRHRSWR